MKILILDDHAAIRDCVKRKILDINPNVEFFECSSIHEGDQVRKSDDHSIDYAVCDLDLKSGCNTEFIESTIRDGIPVMVYSAHVNRAIIEKLESLKVTCYVAKISNVENLHIGLKSLFEGKSFQCPIVQQSKQSTEEFKEIDRLSLTKAQKRVLKVLDEGFDRIETSRKLSLSLTTVNNHIARARELNDCKSLDELMRRYRFWDY
jgi:DNA-binding NarL/FixJ family response regulator